MSIKGLKVLLAILLCVVTAIAPLISVVGAKPVGKNPETLWSSTEFDLPFSTSISPGDNSGFPGDNVGFTVMVKNTGADPDNYGLTVSDDANWGLLLGDNLLEIAAGENLTTVLTVTIPDNDNLVGVNDNITVIATSQATPSNIENVVCSAHAISAIVRGVTVSISPGSQGGPNGTTLNYGVTITNTGNVDDTYSLTATDNSGWSPSIPTPFPIPAFTYGTITMSVTVPSNAAIGTIDNIVVTANGTGVSADNSCTAQVTIAKRVSLSISPVSENGLNGDNLSYTVTVKNTGNVLDNYSLTVTDNAGWSPNVSLTLLTLSPGNSENATLSLTIPSNAMGGAIDNIKVKATSETDNTVIAENRCTAILRVVRGVNVSISPTSENGSNGDNKTFSVTVTNLGNVPDNYSLTPADTENWSPSVLPTSLVVAPFGSSENATLKVTIPNNAPNGSEDNITVTARSMDNTAIDNDRCTVRAIAIQVRVSISPAENGAIPGQSIRFTVSVTNIRDNADNYILHASDNLGWNISLADNLIENVLPGRIRITSLTVVIPGNAVPDARDGITVTVTSRNNDNIIGIATCVARSIAITRSVDVSISPAEASGMPGDGLSFTIKVTNTGNIIDNYDLTLGDNAGWGLSISDNTLEIRVRDNLNVELNIKIPDDALPGTRDNISVTVTSRENAAVRNSVTCLVEALVLRRVEVTISPGYLNGLAGAMLN